MIYFTITNKQILYVVLENVRNCVNIFNGPICCLDGRGHFTMYNDDFILIFFRYIYNYLYYFY